MRIPSPFLVVALALGFVGCSKTQSVSAASPQDANGNLAPVGDYNPAPVYNDTDNAGQTYAYDDSTDDTGEVVYAPEPPPALPVYSQPPCPGDDYIWTPGYWAWAETGYYWVPGAWIIAPYVDALWTPPYWEFFSGRYRWHRGYWGTHIGFYGGIDYGFGYTGRGYYGGYWNGGRFAYNRAVTNVNVTVVHNVYNRQVNNVAVNRVSYNGGPHGIQARPIAAESAALRERRTAPVAAQIQHARNAEQNRQQFASVNRGRPTIAAQNSALATPYRAPAARPAGSELPRHAAQNERPRQEFRPTQPAPVPAQAAPPVQSRRERPDFGRQIPEQRPVAPLVQQQAIPAQRPEIPRAESPREPRQPEPQNRPQFERRQQVREAPQAHEAPQPRQARPEPPRPQPQARPESPRPQPQARPEPAARPAPAQQEHGRGDSKDRH